MPVIFCSSSSRFELGNDLVLQDEFYLGLRQKRIPQDQYLELMDEIMESLIDL